MLGGEFSEEDHMVEKGDKPMADVRHLTKDGRPAGPIRTVIGAINYIDNDLDERFRNLPAFRAAKEALHLALEGKMPAQAARALFVAALQESRLSWR